MRVGMRQHTHAALHAWRDPEFWGPRGRGCARCHERPPVVWGLPCGALCFPCLAACFPGWDEERLIQWLGGQQATRIRQEERRAALAAYREHGYLAPARAYKAQYGVWLLDIPEP